mmetsp:Transcript_20232/g.37566  ORF Transcript_20232/g.37566 Transcript_20232/m.37566 type:complete len:81 (-) Transcript_20232:1139-1381(-)
MAGQFCDLSKPSDHVVVEVIELVLQQSVTMSNFFGGPRLSSLQLTNFVEAGIDLGLQVGLHMHLQHLRRGKAADMIESGL